jgi:hypothetical protein
MAESIKISALGELISGSVLGTTKVPVVSGGVTKYVQISSIKAYTNSDTPTDIELTAELAAINSTISGLTTANIDEDASSLYYTDARVTTKLNTLNVLSGSTTSLNVTDGNISVNAVDKITFTNATIVDALNGDVNVTIDVPSSLSVIDNVGPTVVTGVDQITFDGATITDTGDGNITVTIPTGISTDISSLNSFSGSINVFTASIRSEINGIESFTASFSSSVGNRITTLEDAVITLPEGLVSASQQITEFGFISESVVAIGTVSGSQQIVELGFVTTSSLATETNYSIISQSIIATNPIDSNLLLSSVYIDKTRTIKFSQFSQSLDSRISAGGGTATIDYVSNVTFNDNTLQFSSVGSAFDGTVTLTNGIISASQQILDLGFPLTTEINKAFIVDRLPVGSVSSSAQITQLGFLNNNEGVVSSSKQIILNNTVSGGFDTSNVEENIDFQYYTDTKVNNILNSLDLISGSNRFNGLISSSTQVNYAEVYNKVLFYTGSNNLIIQSGSNSTNAPFIRLTIDTSPTAEQTALSNIVYGSTLISASTQIANLGFIGIDAITALNNFTGSAGEFGITSASLSDRITNVGNSAITASEQIDYNVIQNILTFSSGTDILISRSLENDITITNIAPAPLWDEITQKPFDIVSSSVQITELGFVNVSSEPISSSTQIQNFDVFALNSNLYYATGALQQNIDLLSDNVFGLDEYTSSLKSAIIVSGSNVNVLGTLTAQQLNITITSSSVQFQSGSTQLGNSADDIHTITGTILLNGSAIGLSQLNAYTASNTSVIANIEAYTASLKSVTLVSSSQQITNFGFISASANTFTGNQTISASLLISGVTEIGGNLIPKTAQGATLGTVAKPFSEIFVSSGSIFIASDNPNTLPTSLSNKDGKIEISAGGLQLLGSGSFNASSGSFSHLSGSITQNGDFNIVGTTTITGSLNISGNINGAPNLVTTSSFNTYTASLIPTYIVDTENVTIINTQNPTAISHMSSSLGAGTYIVSYNTQFTVDTTSNITIQASEDLQTLYNQLYALPATVTGHGLSYGNGETLGPGIYTQAAASNVTGTLTLDASGDTNALFVFRCVGALTTGASAKVLLINGAQSSNVFFVSEGAASTGANTIISGSLITNQAAVSTGADTRIQGRMLAVNGAAGLGSATILSSPIGTSVSASIGSLDLFNIFCATGSVSNTGASSIELSIGTNNGTITGFATAAVGGSIIPGGGTPLNIFRIGVFVDNVLINDSLRSTSRPITGTTFEFPIVLQTVATITDGQTIDIKAYSELGIQSVGPRMSLVITPISI